MSSLPSGQRFLFAIVSGDETLFQLDEHTGVLETTRSLDHIELQRIQRNFSRTLNISVTDGAFTTFLMVSVEFLPSPSATTPIYFDQLLYSIWLSEKRYAFQHKVNTKTQHKVNTINTKTWRSLTKE